MRDEDAAVAEQGGRRRLGGGLVEAGGLERCAGSGWWTGGQKSEREVCGGRTGSPAAGQAGEEAVGGRLGGGVEERRQQPAWLTGTVGQASVWRVGLLEVVGALGAADWRSQGGGVYGEVGQHGCGEGGLRRTGALGCQRRRERLTVRGVVVWRAEMAGRRQGRRQESGDGQGVWLRARWRSLRRRGHLAIQTRDHVMASFTPVAREHVLAVAPPFR
ncbi:uncharacterized protein A4U43_C01F33430 [Asparagus officinalis]|uniref:Uncharacterized protein n=1 Tax=Asparagus officinalis TaxID=4686 RepID=A0A5P1FUR9_ASPOF|nr:uncharacterized protein A4U43_C01F33430 [Asparagus officinalis]